MSSRCVQRVEQRDSRGDSWALTRALEGGHTASIWPGCCGRSPLSAGFAYACRVGSELEYADGKRHWREPWKGPPQNGLAMARDAHESRRPWQTVTPSPPSAIRPRPSWLPPCCDDDRHGLRPRGSSGVWSKQQAAAHDRERAAAPTGAKCYAAHRHLPAAAFDLHPQLCAFCQVEKGQAPVPSMRRRPNGWPKAVDTSSCATWCSRCRPATTWPTTAASLVTGTMGGDNGPAASRFAIEVAHPDFWGGHRGEAERCGGPAKQRLGVVLARAVCLQPQHRDGVQATAGQVRRVPPTPVPLGLLAACRQLAPAIPKPIRPVMLGPGRITLEEVIGGPGHLRGRGCERVTIRANYLAAFPVSPARESLLATRGIYEAGELAQGLGFNQVRLRTTGFAQQFTTPARTKTSHLPGDGGYLISGN